MPTTSRIHVVMTVGALLPLASPLHSEELLDKISGCGVQEHAKLARLRKSRETLRIPELRERCPLSRGAQTLAPGPTCWLVWLIRRFANLGQGRAKSDDHPNVQESHDTTNETLLVSRPKKSRSWNPYERM